MAIWKRQFDLAKLNASSPNTLSHTLGIQFSGFGDDWLEATMPVDARNHQPFGLLHGGASVALAETLGSMAGWLTLSETSARTVGIEINANHVRGVRSGTVTGTARPLHLGRSTQVWEIRIVNEAGELTCVSRITLAVVS